MLGHRLRRWPNIKPALDERLVFAGISVFLGCWQGLLWRGELDRDNEMGGQSRDPASQPFKLHGRINAPHGIFWQKFAE